MPKILLIISIVILVFAILGGVFILRPKYQDFSTKKIELKNKETELEQKQQHYVRVEELSEKMKEYEEELKKIDSALPTEPSLSSLFNFVQNLVSQSGLILETLGSAKVGSSPTGGTQKISFSLSATGFYSALKQFLSVIYNNTRLIEVESISFGSSEEGGLFEFKIGLLAHFYEKAKESTDLEVPLPEFPEVPR